MRISRRRANQTRLLEVFREFDKDVNCKLERPEVRRLAKHLYPNVTRAELWYFMIMLDVNGHLRKDGISYKVWHLHKLVLSNDILPDSV